MLTRAEYNEFAGELDLLAGPLRASLPHVRFIPYVPERGCPGIVASGKRMSGAKYPFALTVLIRWSNSAIATDLAHDDERRAELRDSFSSNARQVLAMVEAPIASTGKGAHKHPRAA